MKGYRKNEEGEKGKERGKRLRGEKGKRVRMK
jgi:hypothetical protein